MDDERPGRFCLSGELASRLTHRGCRGVWLRDSSPFENEELDEDLARGFLLA